MKYPALLSWDELLPQLDSFDAIIDARSPSEFAEDHIPGAINCPVLNDEERARIGTMYKQIGAFEAKKLGAALVARNIAQHIEAKFIDMPREWKPLIYCWRGGNRSGSLAHILAKIGWPAIQLDGGYRVYRRYVNDELLRLPAAFTFNVVCGTTGSGKSRLLQTLANQGEQVLDLEQLACHKGSVLGGLPSEPQPTQKRFESLIWQALRRFRADRIVYVESESKKIGNLRVPDALMEAMRASPCIALDLSQRDRIRLLMEEYPHFIAEPDKLNHQLDCLIQLHGKEKIAHWQAMANLGEIEVLVTELLTAHYDPAYLRSIARNFPQYSTARKVELAGISPEAFADAADLIRSGQAA
ncbi:tRNA 2-selenouridine(34) synthase MnmH [Oxalobacteraceae bacterium R-40]|uniref:tRNA 2-selenouridine(34) synthase MnmH n=1 Tax=Keguizhuia sedimenti TaxID=3064264 RepID=A0ABU1BNL2_9BURK|nr:tRNA 2-selenouridine(34) synthase MnmH [Oxalobacteraceae bacterium R-40]